MEHAQRAEPSLGPIGVYACRNESSDLELHYRGVYEAIDTFK